MSNLNMRYFNGEIDDDIPYTGVINTDPETDLFYDEDGDVVDQATVDGFCMQDGKGEDDE